MKTGSFTRWLKKNYPRAAFNRDGTISKVYVRRHIREWTPKIRAKAQFFLNTVKR